MESNEVSTLSKCLGFCITNLESGIWNREVLVWAELRNHISLTQSLEISLALSQNAFCYEQQLIASLLPPSL